MTTTEECTKKRDAREKLLFCQSKGDVTRDDSKRRFLAQHSLQHCCDIVSNGCNIVPTLEPCVAL